MICGVGLQVSSLQDISDIAVGKKFRGPKVKENYFYIYIFKFSTILLYYPPDDYSTATCFPNSLQCISGVDTW